MVLPSFMGAARLLPAGLHLPAILSLAAGIVMLLLGGKVMKVGFAVLGTAAGALAGGVLLPGVLPERVLAVPSPYAGLLIGGLAGLAAACALFRFSLATAGALTFAVIAGLGASAVLSLRGELRMAPEESKSLLIESEPSDLRRELEGTTETAVAAAKRFVESVRGTEKGSVRNESGPSRAGTGILVEARTAASAARVRVVADAWWSRAKSLWMRTDDTSRLRIVWCVLAGALSGLVIGAFWPSGTSRMITALAGAGLILFSGLWLATAADIGVFGLRDGLLNAGSLVWGGLWLGLSVLGFAAQGKLVSKRVEGADRDEAAAGAKAAAARA